MGKRTLKFAIDRGVRIKGEGPVVLALPRNGEQVDLSLAGETLQVQEMHLTPEYNSSMSRVSVKSRSHRYRHVEMEMKVIPGTRVER